jgi:hypothetical protein
MVDESMNNDGLDPPATKSLVMLGVQAWATEVFRVQEQQKICGI